MESLYKSNGYGMVEVLDNSDRNAVRVRFIDTGYETTVRRHNLVAGKATDHPLKQRRAKERRRLAYKKGLERDKIIRAANRKERAAPQPPEDMKPGQIFPTKSRGDVEIIKYENHDKVYIRFVNTGYETVTSSCTLRRCPCLNDPLAITVFGVGRIGVGPHKAHHKSKDTKPYSIWRAMLRRCYYGSSEWKTYHDCEVCDEWLTFQSFAQWYEDNHPNDGQTYDLDKDIIVRGNTVYAPDRCKFVTRQENARYRRDR